MPTQPSLWSTLILYAMGLNLSGNIIPAALQNTVSEKNRLQKTINICSQRATPLLEHHHWSGLTSIFYTTLAE